MYDPLTEQESVELSRFRYVDVLDQESTSVSIGTLIHSDNMKTFLEDVQAEIQAPDLNVAASVFMKRFAFVAVIYLYALSSWNKRLHFNLDSLYLQSSKREGNWLPEYYFNHLLAESCPNGDRVKWRDQALEHLFKEILSPILESLAQESKISRFILWENIAVYLFWLYEKVLDPQQTLGKQDYQYIVEQAPGELFGTYKRNPLQLYTDEPVFLEELNESIRIRKTCCFTYRLGAKRTYCKTFPLYCKKFSTGKRNKN